MTERGAKQQNNAGAWRCELSVSSAINLAWPKQVTQAVPLSPRAVEHLLFHSTTAGVKGSESVLSSHAVAYAAAVCTAPSITGSVAVKWKLSFLGSRMGYGIQLQHGYIPPFVQAELIYRIKKEKGSSTVTSILSLLERSCARSQPDCGVVWHCTILHPIRVMMVFPVLKPKSVLILVAVIAPYWLSAVELCHDSPLLSLKPLPPECWMKARPATSQEMERRALLHRSTATCLAIIFPSADSQCEWPRSGGVGLGSISPPTAGNFLPSQRWSAEQLWQDRPSYFSLLSFFFFFLQSVVICQTALLFGGTQTSERKLLFFLFIK